MFLLPVVMRKDAILFTPARPANAGQRKNLHLFWLFYQDEIR
jgi:hypothetical protein